MNITLGSLFDGIGGFPYAGTFFGITPIWASEIEPWPIKVTEKHFPNMKHLGDITQINGGEIEPVDIITFGSPCTRLSVAGRHDGFDITFECQGSKEEPHEIYTNKIRATDKYQYLYNDICPVCGKKLTETNESALFFHAIRIISEMRDVTNGVCPRFIVWENVPGAFSSNKGEDFRAVLEEIAEAEIPMPSSGKWATAGMVRTERIDIAWRTLDAQYWGVPQRRRRIFLVADFGGQCAAEILFERESMSGDIAESGEAREEVAAGIGAGVEDAIAIDAYNHAVTGDITATLTAESGSSATHSGPMCIVAPFNTGQITSPQNGNKVEFGLPCHTLSANEHPPSAIISYGIQGSMIGRADKNGPQGDGINEEVSFTLNTTDRHAVAYGIDQQGGQRQPCVIAFAANQRDEVRDLNDKAGALQAEPGMKQQTFIYGICSDSSNSMKSSNPHSGIYKADTTRTLDLNGGNPTCNQGGMAIVQTYSFQRSDEFKETDKASTQSRRQYKDATDLVVGALCARDFKGVGNQYVDEGKCVIENNHAVRRLTPLECTRLQGFPDYWLDIVGMSDTQKYKAIGNSVAIPCVKFVLGGIARVLQI